MGEWRRSGEIWEIAYLGDQGDELTREGVYDWLGRQHVLGRDAALAAGKEPPKEDLGGDRAQRLATIVDKDGTLPPELEGRGREVLRRRGRDDPPHTLRAREDDVVPLLLEQGGHDLFAASDDLYGVAIQI